MNWFSIIISVVFLSFYIYFIVTDKKKKKEQQAALIKEKENCEVEEIQNLLDDTNFEN